MPDQPAPPPSNDAASFNSDFSSYVQTAQQNEAVNFMNGITTSPPAPAAAATPSPAAVPEGGVPPAPGLGRDIALGVIHSPRSVARGAIEGLNSIGDFAQKLASYLPTFATVDDSGRPTWLPSLTTIGTDRANINKGLAAEGSDIHLPDTVDLPVPVDNRTPTVTGHAIENIARFATGFAAMGPLGEAAGVGEALNSGDIAGNIAKFVAGDIISTDQQEKNLSNIVQDFPSLKNPVNDFLAAKPDDGFAEAKLKQAVNDLPLGAAGEALYQGVGLLKSAIGAKMAAAEPLIAPTAAEAEQAGPSAAHFAALGDAQSPDLIIQRKMAQADAATSGLNIGDVTQTVQPKTYQINFARITGPEDIQTVMDQMVNQPDLFKGIENARRGVQTNEQTLAGAQDINGFASLLQRRTGAAFNDQQIVAARQVYYDTTAKLLEVAKAAADPNAGEIDQFNFRKMLSIHSAVQNEFMGVRAEAGRALAAWGIPLAGDGGANAAAISQALNNFGGAGASKDLAARLVALGDRLNTDQINMIAQKSALARTQDAVTEAWTLGLLTNPVTHVKNLASNFTTGISLGLERLAQAAMPGSGTDLREGTAFFNGMLQAQKLAWSNMKTAFDTGESSFGLNKVDMPPSRATAQGILDPNDAMPFLSKAVDGYGALLEKYVGRALLAADEFAKTVMYQSQMYAVATRDGISQGLEGDALAAHVSDVLQEQSATMKADAVTFAQYATYTRKLSATGQAVQDIISRNPSLRFIAPFVRTPGNIFKFAFERTPLAPLSAAIRADIMAGGVRRATALTRMSMGSSVMAIGADLAQNGHITGSGPADPKVRAALGRTGWKPYSLKLGDEYHSYAGIEPIATLLGMSADLSEIMGNYEAYDIPAQQDVDKLITAAGIAAGNQVVGKTFMTGFAEMAQVFSDPGRYVEPFLQKFAGSFVPAGVAALNRAVDPVQREVFSMIDDVKSRISGFSETLPAARNVWGQEVQPWYPQSKSFAGATGERLLSLVNPFYTSTEKDDPVDRWMLQKGFSIDMPPKVQAFDGVRIDLHDYPDIYSRLVQLRGDGVKPIKYGSQTMQQFFSNLAAQKDPFARHVGFFMAIGQNDFDHQQNFIDQVVRDYTAEAKKQLATEFGNTIPPLVMQGKMNAAAIDRARGPAGAALKALP